MDQSLQAKKITIAFLGVLFGFAGTCDPTPTASKNEGFEQTIACSRNAEVRVINPSRGDGKCNARAVIQGIAYVCGKEQENTKLTFEFLKKLNANARSRCEEFCNDQGSGCVSHFTEASECGFSVPTLDALTLGKQLGCHPKSCDGQAMIYCSIYKGSFFRFDENLFKNSTPNCYCTAE